MKRLEVISAIALLLFCGYVGYSTNYTNTITASEVPVIKPMTIPQTNISLDLNSGKLFTSAPNSTVTVAVTKKDSIVYKTLVKEKKVPYIVRQLPPVAPKRVTLASMAQY